MGNEAEEGKGDRTSVGVGEEDPPASVAAGADAIDDDRDRPSMPENVRHSSGRPPEHVSGDDEKGDEDGQAPPSRGPAASLKMPPETIIGGGGEASNVESDGGEALAAVISAAKEEGEAFDRKMQSSTPGMVESADDSSSDFTKDPVICEDAAVFSAAKDEGEAFAQKMPSVASGEIQNNETVAQLPANKPVTFEDVGDAPSATTTDSVAPSSTQTSVTPGSRGSTSTPGAYHVYPADRPPTPEGGTFVVIESDNADHPNHARTTNNATANEGASTPAPAEAQVGHDVSAHAYLVEEGEQPPSATVVETCFGVERKRLAWIGGGALVVLAIVLGSVLGVLIPRSKNQSEKESNVCGPLCGGEGSEVPDPHLVVLGVTCEEWDSQSTALPKPANATCDSLYLPAAYGCGCSEVEVSSGGCGKLCSDGSDLPDPDMEVRDINNVLRTCKDWELLAQFESDPDECVNYNAMGVVCGCEGNDPHPDACGSLCGEGAASYLHGGRHPVWNTRCEDWDALSTFLPRWYNNDEGETCEDYYQEVRYGCACPGVKKPAQPSCGTLCQQRRVCQPLCEDGSDVTDPGAVVKKDTCLGWELSARTEVHEFICPIYHVMGAQCGCQNTPPPNACGGLCSSGDPPDPTREVQGQTCEEWDYTSRYLPGDFQALYGDLAGQFDRSCSEYFDKFSYGCDCPGVEPPPDGCGPLCEDGSSVPDPEKIVNGKTCRDQEINSLFEKDPNQCALYRILGLRCDCPREDDYAEECFELRHLENRTYYWSSGNYAFAVSFGDDGVFSQIDQVNNYFTLGYLVRLEDNIATYGGGAPCGVHGPRSGQVEIVEDPSITKPTLAHVNEPGLCFYKAELRVPKFCNETESKKSGVP